MRILSIIITLCFIIAVPACASQSKKDRDKDESKARPTAAQSSANRNDSAPAHSFTATTSRSHEEAPKAIPGAMRSSYQQDATRRSESGTRAADRNQNNSGARPGFKYETTRPVATRSDNNTGSRPNSYTPRTGSRPDPTSGPERRASLDPPSRPDAPASNYNPAGPDRRHEDSGNRRDNNDHNGSYLPQPRNNPQAPERNLPESSLRKDDNRSNKEIDRRPAQNASRDDHKAYTVGHNDDHKAYTAGHSDGRANYKVGYHPSGKFTVPKGYTQPSYRQGHYYYAPAYHPKPCNYGHWAFSYAPGFSYRSVYFNFSLFPYVQVNRISEHSYTSITYLSEPIYVSGGDYYPNSRYDHIDDVLADIRSAWVSGRFDLIDQHVRTNRTIAVLLDGEYDYSISSDDYLAMTHDAIGELSTVSFTWDTVRERQDGMVTAYGQHKYRGSDRTRTVYVSYTLQKVGGDYFITEVGSSLNPLN